MTKLSLVFQQDTLEIINEIIIIDVNLTLSPNINVYIRQLGPVHFNKFSYSLSVKRYPTPRHHFKT